MNLVTDLIDWLASLPADFAFLLALPFLVAAAGLLADRGSRRKADQRAGSRRRAREAPATHRTATKLG